MPHREQMGTPGTPIAEDDREEYVDPKALAMEGKHWILQLLIWEDWSDGTLLGLKDDLFAGMTLLMTQVPTAVAFALLAKMNPLSGLYATFWIGLIMAIFNGRPGIIAGAAGATSVVFPEIVEPHGPEALYAMSILCGILMALPGIFGVAKYVRLLPTPVMIGFVDGLSIIITRSQVESFLTPEGTYVKGGQAGWTAFLCIICFSIIFIIPRFTKFIPSTFVAILIGTAIEHAAGLGTVTVGDLYEISGAFPTPRVPDIDWNDSALITDIITMAIIVSIIAVAESLLTVHFLNVLTETTCSFERESLALGVANFISGWFQGFAGCAVVGACILNFHSGGGYRRLSGFIMGFGMIIVVLAISPFLNLIPMGALAAVMFSIVVQTFDWRTWEMIFLMKVPLGDGIIILTVTIVTVFTDLAVAVIVGVIVAALIFVGDMSRGQMHVTVGEDMDEDLFLRARVLHIKGTLFFASCSDLYNTVEALHSSGLDAGDDVILDFGNGQCTVHDFSAVDTLQEIALMFSRHKRRLHVRNLDPISSRIVRTAIEFAPDVHNDSRTAFLGRCILTRVKPPSAGHSPGSPGTPATLDSPQTAATNFNEPFPGTNPQEEAEADRLKLLRDIRIGVYLYSPELEINYPVTHNLLGWQKWLAGHRHCPAEGRITFNPRRFANKIVKGEAISPKEMEIIEEAVAEMFDVASKYPESTAVPSEVTAGPSSKESEQAAKNGAAGSEDDDEDAPPKMERRGTAGPGAMTEMREVDANGTAASE